MTDDGLTAYQRLIAEARDAVRPAVDEQHGELADAR